MTDTELYRLVVGLSEREVTRPLEEYLRALLEHVRGASREPSIEALYSWFEASLTTAPAPFDEAWRAQAAALCEKEEPDSREILLMQIVDLRAMQEAGVFEDQLRYLGVQAPSRRSWYNFDPFTYIECAFRGAIGDGLLYEESGELDEDGLPLSQSKEDPTEVQGSWKLLEKLLWCGQLYE